MKELESFQSLLYHRFKDTVYYKQKLTSLHQPVPLSASAKTHKFENLSDMNVSNLKLPPIINQTRIGYYKTGKGVSQYLKPLTKNEIDYNNVQGFSSRLSNVPISEDEEDVSYDVEALFTNVFIEETIDFICKEIYVHEKLETIYKEAIFK